MVPPHQPLTVPATCRQRCSGPTRQPPSSSTNGSVFVRNLCQTTRVGQLSVNASQPLLNLHLVSDEIPIVFGANKHEGEALFFWSLLTMSNHVYWMFVGGPPKDSALRVMKHYHHATRRRSPSCSRKTNLQKDRERRRQKAQRSCQSGGGQSSRHESNHQRGICFFVPLPFAQLLSRNRFRNRRTTMCLCIDSDNRLMYRYSRNTGAR